MKQTTYQKTSISFHPSKQSGIAMIVVLIFLFVLTLLGVSSMTTSSLEERMATNSQTKEATFQAAESAINEAIADTNLFDTVSATASPTTKSYTEGAYTANATINLGSGISGGLVEGSGTDSSAMQFTITSTSTNSGTGASSTNMQGVKILSANDPSKVY